MVDGKPSHGVGKFGGECSDTLRGNQRREIFDWQCCPQADSLALLNSDLLTLRNRVGDGSGCGNVVLREAPSRRPAERLLECHGFTAQIQELSNVSLEWRFGKVRGQVEQRDEDVIVFEWLTQQIDHRALVDGRELRQFVSGHRPVPKFDLRDHGPGQASAFRRSLGKSRNRDSGSGKPGREVCISSVRAI